MSSTVIVSEDHVDSQSFYLFTYLHLNNNSNLIKLTRSDEMLIAGK